MPLYKDIYYADNSTALSIANISAAEATSTGDAIEALKLKTAVPVADATARNALFPSPTQGNAVWRNDRGWEERYYALYNSSTNPGGAPAAGWYPVNSISSIIYVRNAANRDAIITSPKQGMSVFNNATGCMETYYEVYNSGTNPGGVTTAGWYPTTNLPVFYGTATGTATTSGTAYTIGASGAAYTELLDRSSWHDASTNPTRITPNIAGYYRVTSGASWATNTTGVRQVTVLKNGTAYNLGTFGNIIGAASNSMQTSTTGIIAMNGSTDYLEQQVAQTSGGSLTYSTQFNVEFVRPL
jgi:hypothetical protein